MMTFPVKNVFLFRGSSPGTHCIGGSASKFRPLSALVGRVSRPVQTKSCQDGTGVPSYGSVARFPSVFVLVFIALTGAANVDSAVPTVTTKTSKTTVQVAEPLTLEITVTAPAGSKVDFLSIGQSLGNFDVNDQLVRADVPSENDVNLRVWTHRLTLESIVAGNLEIPSLEIQVRRDANIQTLRTEVIPIRVASVLEDRADPTKFRDIQPVVDIEIPEPASHVWIWWMLGGFGGIAAATLMLITVAKRKTWMTPNVWALRELEHLRHSEVMRSSDSELVTENLTAILRDYLELQFDIPSTMQTTKELLHEIEATNRMSTDLAKGFAVLFENADLARFAGLQMSSAELTRMIDDAERLVGMVSNPVLN